MRKSDTILTGYDNSVFECAYSNDLGSVDMSNFQDAVRGSLPHIPSWAMTASTGYSGGPPMDFGYTEPKPVPVERCEYCGIKAFPSERLCVGCGAPL